MSTRQAAQRAGVAQSTWVDAEQREIAGTISLGQLRRLGAALDCRLLHALVPDLPLQEKVEARAGKLAQQEVGAVAHSMALEQQLADDVYTKVQIEERKRELLRGRRSPAVGCFSERVRRNSKLKTRALPAFFHRSFNRLNRYSSMIKQTLL